MKNWFTSLNGSTTLNRGEVAGGSFPAHGSLYVEQIAGIEPFSAQNPADSGQNASLGGPKCSLNRVLGTDHG